VLDLNWEGVGGSGGSNAGGGDWFQERELGGYGMHVGGAV